MLDGEAEEAIGHHADEHDPAREHDLNGRKRSERHRRDVQQPGAHGDEHADREPARSKQVAGRAQRVSGPDRRRKRRTALLVEEREVRHERAADREADANLNHGLQVQRRRRGRSPIASFVSTRRSPL
jgi:hypothetical protein